MPTLDLGLPKQDSDRYRRRIRKQQLGSRAGLFGQVVCLCYKWIFWLLVGIYIGLLWSSVSNAGGQ